jgi:type IX secretion system PorP/SprF family membrane protein
MKKRISFILAVLMTIGAKAQDPHFSQFFASPLTLNPANTGRFDGSFRVAGNYRNQWPTINNAFTTATLSVDFGILRGTLPEMDTWGVGFLVLSDQSGNKILRNNFIGLSTAYHKSLDEDGLNSIAIGFQAVYAQKRLDITQAKFSDQITELGFTNVSQDIFSQQNLNTSYLDMNTGILGSFSTNGRNSLYAGVSYYHVARPKESLSGADFYLPARWTFHGGALLPLDDSKTFHASMLLQKQAGAMETIVGGAMSFLLSEEESSPVQLYTGAWYRVGDAVIPYLGLEFRSIWFGFSYDINHSGLKTASQGRGGNEISIIYVRQPSDPRNRQVECPRF